MSPRELLQLQSKGKEDFHVTLYVPKAGAKEEITCHSIVQWQFSPLFAATKFC